MIVPKIIFKYSRIYDQHWREVYSKIKDYPSEQKIQNDIEKVNKLWRRDEKKILKELSVITDLKWKEKSIACYVVGKCIPFSDPLTIKVYDDYPLNYFIDVLTHELIHQLFTQNEKQLKKAWVYFHKKYKSENFNTTIHIPVHAIHSHIFMKYFGEKRLEREIQSLNHLINYKKSWNIVREEGYQNIIKEFKRRVK